MRLGIAGNSSNTVFGIIILFVASYVGGFYAGTQKVYLNTVNSISELGPSVAFLLLYLLLVALVINLVWKKAFSRPLLRKTLTVIVVAKISECALITGLLLADYPWEQLGTKLNQAHGLPNFVLGQWHGIPYVACLLVSAMLSEESTRKTLRFFSIFGITAIVVLIFRSLSLSHQATNERLVDAGEESSRQVVWIVFDEFDPGIAFSQRGGEEQAFEKVPNFQQLRRTSVEHSAMFPPARDTLGSIPGMLLGSPISGYQPLGPARLQLTLPDYSRRIFSNEGSVFDSVSKRGLTSSILGFYHPYCEIFSNADCKTYSLLREVAWNDGLRAFLPRALKDLMFAKIEQDNMSSVTRAQINELPGFLAKKHSFLYAHLNFPHPPAAYAELLFEESPDDKLQSYWLNLRLSDAIMGDILAKFPRDGRERLLVVTSDHWYRGNQKKKASPALFLAKRLDDNNAVQVLSPSNLVHVKGLIEAFFDGNIKSNRDIANHLKSKPFYDTYIPPI